MTEIGGAFWVIPDSLERKFQEKMAEILAEYPQLEPDKDRIRHDLLSVFHEHGHMDVTITPNPDHQPTEPVA